MHTRHWSLSAGILCLAMTGTAAAENNFGVGIKAGTLGAGIEGSWRPLPYLDLRLGGNTYEYEDSGSQAGIPYDGTLGLENYYGTVNLHFPMSPMRLTLGAFANGNQLDLVGQPYTTVVVGGNTYTAAEAGTLTSTSTFPSAAPYLGVGLDFRLFGKVGLNFDFGLLWQGVPEVSLLADGALAGDPDFQAALERERLELEQEVSDLKAWPVLSLGFVVNF
jgi:hypothetical protein